MKIHYVVVRVAEDDDGTMEGEVTHESIDNRVLSFAAASLLGQLPEELRDLVLQPTATPPTPRE